MVSSLDNHGFRFPLMLEKFIFDNLRAIYKPDPKKAYENIYANEEHQRINLGTYFPRSFIEAYMIFEELLDSDYIKNYFKTKKDFFILDIGSGTGGNLIGLLWFMKDYFQDFDKKNFHIVSIDGNDMALDVQAKLIKKFFFYNTDIFLKSSTLLRDDFKEILANIYKGCGIKNKFDIIMTFKYVNFHIKYLHI